ncbi:MAG: FAD-linked oxidase C-terminal domain-containing protein [Gilvibacter sp.]
MSEQLSHALKFLEKSLEGSLFTDDLHKAMYATDASVYRMIPLAVCYPKTTEDLQLLVGFATAHKSSLIMRAAGTSLAGQCVGEGIVVDMSKHFTAIIDIDATAKVAKVQPGVIRDELNQSLAQFGLFFGPNTSTTNRCMIGGMVGNNSSGTTSIKYGVTRDKVKAITFMMHDGTIVSLGHQSIDDYNLQRNQSDALAKVYSALDDVLTVESNRRSITEAFPKEGIHRRNTGYALDAMLNATVYGGDDVFNLSKLICGSEGTLGIILDITVALDELPPKHEALVVAHYDSIDACLKDVFPLSKHELYACEMLDKTILDCTKNKPRYAQHRTLLEGDPKALLLLEVKAASRELLKGATDRLVTTLKTNQNAYECPIYTGDKIAMAMELRAAGLGLLGSMVGDDKAVACIEDTAVDLKDLAPYIKEFGQLMQRHGQKVVYYAHAGAGELHLRPILNLKKSEDVAKFKEITSQVAALVKKYQGSLSGEHGDGIVRGAYLPFMVGEQVYGFMKQIKEAFDPCNIFNPGKIIDAYKMDENLRYVPDAQPKQVESFLDFSESLDILKAAEQCNGSGDCRKPATANGTMCPSYHATKNEKDTTRARANVLREVLTNSKKPNAFNSKPLKEAFDLCLSCKACSSECPSSVNVSKFKAEFMYQYKKENGSSFSNTLFAKSTARTRKMAKNPKFWNVLFSTSLSSFFIKKIGGIHTKRSLPKLAAVPFFKITLEDYDYQVTQRQRVVLYIDEFSDYFDAQIALDAFRLLKRLGYDVHVLSDIDSGRALLSKGFLEEAKAVISANVTHFLNAIKGDALLIGVEPSAILTYRDEATYLADDVAAAKQLAERTLLIEEFIADQIANQHIKASQFTKEPLSIKIHSHCYQKALSNQKHTFDMLNLPENYSPVLINSGCCGMAGSFGYEKDHYEVSMQIGEQRLFKAVRKASNEVVIAANGTSCRHQIEDGTSRKAMHPVTILLKALKTD